MSVDVADSAPEQSVAVDEEQDLVVSGDVSLRQLRQRIENTLTPRRASRRAASRSISALRASRTKLDFSLSPVKACACATNSSSSASVVRMSFSILRHIFIIE